MAEDQITTQDAPEAVAEELIPTEEAIMEALKVVNDPELGISIVDLGLIYGVQFDQESGGVVIDMTLTTPACPLGPVIEAQSHGVLRKTFPAVKNVDINLVWSPRWDPRTMASEEAKAELGIW